jgi:hypothetical protein
MPNEGFLRYDLEISFFCAESDRFREQKSVAGNDQTANNPTPLNNSRLVGKYSPVLPGRQFAHPYEVERFFTQKGVDFDSRHRHWN